MKRLSLLIAAALVVGVLAGPAIAGGGGRRGSEIWIEPSSYARVDGVMHVGDSVMFGFKTNYWDEAGGTGPWLALECFRAGADYEYEGQLSGVMILADSRAGFPGGWGYGEPFVLSGTAWKLGPANCTGILGHRGKTKFMVDATVDFYVEG